MKTTLTNSIWIVLIIGVTIGVCLLLNKQPDGSFRTQELFGMDAVTCLGLMIAINVGVFFGAQWLVTKNYELRVQRLKVRVYAEQSFQ